MYKKKPKNKKTAATPAKKGKTAVNPVVKPKKRR